jgi:hypothetical protein
VLTFPRVSTSKLRLVMAPDPDAPVAITELGLYRHPLTDTPDLTADGSYSASSSWDEQPGNGVQRHRRLRSTRRDDHADVPDVTGTKARLLNLSGTGNAPIVYELSIYRL